MKDEKNIEHKEKELFAQLGVDFPRSREEVWNSMEGLMEEDSQREKTDVQSGRITGIRWTTMSIAASFVLLIAMGLFAKFYTVSHEIEAGAFASYVLPDGSEIHLNAESSISYSPYWWRFERRVELAGEAFFEIEKGKRFAINSLQGRTEVLGTSFNIYARDDVYQVYCVTGKVRVTDWETNQIVLTTGELASRNLDGAIQEKTEFLEEAVLSWRLNKFVYDTTPLSKVFKDLERQYGIKLDMAVDSIDNYSYTGLFERSVSVKEALEIICYSFELEFEKKEDNSYHIRQN